MSMSPPPNFKNTKERLYYWMEPALGPDIVRCGRKWRGIAGWSQMGYRLVVYRNADREDEYCMHGGYDWEEHEWPTFGFIYGTYHTWSFLLDDVAAAYDRFVAYYNSLSVEERADFENRCKKGDYPMTL